MKIEVNKKYKFKLPACDYTRISHIESNGAFIYNEDGGTIRKFLEEKFQAEYYCNLYFLAKVKDILQIATGRPGEFYHRITVYNDSILLYKQVSIIVTSNP